MRLCFFAIVVQLLASVIARSDALPPLSQSNELARTGSIINLPGLTIHGGEHKFIEATGQMAITNGILEFIAVETGGRDYESLVTLDCKPSALQFALILIGCEAGTVPFRAKAGEKIGDRLQLELEWTAAGKATRQPVEALLRDRKTNKVPANLPWIFTGSYFVKDLSGQEVFLADVEKAFISLWWSSAIPVNLGGEFGNPYRSEDQGFEVNSAAVPPTGTPVKLIFRKR